LYANDDNSTLLSVANHFTDDQTIPRDFNHSFIVRLLKNPLYVKADSDIYNFLSAKGCKMTNEVDDYLGEKGVYLYGTERRNLTTCHFGDVALSKCNATVALHDGLIDSALWLKCQYKLAERAKMKNSGRLQKNSSIETKKTWLLGLMKCEYCGTAIHVKIGKDREKAYISCYGRTLHTCYDRTTAYKLTEVENYVEQKLLAFLEERANVKTESENKSNSKINMLKIEITKIEKKIDNLLEAIGEDDDGLMIKTIKGKIATLNNDKNQKTLEITNITSKQSSNSLDDIDLHEILKSWNEFDVETKQRIARVAIEKIIVSNEAIEIIFY